MRLNGRRLQGVSRTTGRIHDRKAWETARSAIALAVIGVLGAPAALQWRSGAAGSLWSRDAKAQRRRHLTFGSLVEPPGWIRSSSADARIRFTVVYRGLYYEAPTAGRTAAGESPRSRPTGSSIRSNCAGCEVPYRPDDDVEGRRLQLQLSARQQERLARCGGPVAGTTIDASTTTRSRSRCQPNASLPMTLGKQVWRGGAGRY